MKLTILGRAEDVEQMIRPIIAERGEKIKITVRPCPIENNKDRRYYVEVETKKNEEKQEVGYI
jgi:hypothetical protein